MPRRDFTEDRRAARRAAGKDPDILPDYGLPQPGVFHLIMWAIRNRGS